MAEKRTQAQAEADIIATTGNFLSVGAIAEVAGKSEITVARWIRSGLLPPDDYVGDREAIFSKHRILNLLPILRSDRAATLLREHQIEGQTND